MKYGPEKTKEIAGYLAKGHTRTDSCILADIHYDTFCEWMKKPEFSDTIKKAELVSKDKHIAIIQKAADKTWQAAAWWLERKHRDEYAVRKEVTGSNGEPLLVTWQKK